MTTLFDPVKAGALDLANRIVMAPLTRNRSPNAVPGPLAVDYYAQRATAGLLITEATAIIAPGAGLCRRARPLCAGAACRLDAR